MEAISELIAVFVLLLAGSFPFALIYWIMIARWWLTEELALSFLKRKVIFILLSAWLLVSLSAVLFVLSVLKLKAL